MTVAVGVARRPRLLAGALVGLLVLAACSGSSAPRITLDGSPRLANDEGVATAITLDRLTLDGRRTYRIDRSFRSFDATTLQPVSLVSRQGMYVQIGHAGNRVSWLASYTLVVNLPGQPGTAFHAGKLAPAARGGKATKGKAVFSDGSVLSVAPGVAIPPAGREARADIDVGSHRVRSFTVTG